MWISSIKLELLLFLVFLVINLLLLDKILLLLLINVSIVLGHVFGNCNWICLCIVVLLLLLLGFYVLLVIVSIAGWAEVSGWFDCLLRKYFLGLRLRRTEISIWSRSRRPIRPIVWVVLLLLLLMWMLPCLVGICLLLQIRTRLQLSQFLVIGLIGLIGILIWKQKMSCSFQSTSLSVVLTNIRIDWSCRILLRNSRWLLHYWFIQITLTRICFKKTWWKHFLQISFLWWYSYTISTSTRPCIGSRCSSCSCGCCCSSRTSCTVMIVNVYINNQIVAICLVRCWIICCSALFVCLNSGWLLRN